VEIIEIRSEAQSLDCTVDVSLDVGSCVIDSAVLENGHAAF
jgi:hypothetical protein